MGWDARHINEEGRQGDFNEGVKCEGEGGRWLACCTPSKPTNSCSFLKAPLCPPQQASIHSLTPFYPSLSCSTPTLRANPTVSVTPLQPAYFDHAPTSGHQGAQLGPPCISHLPLSGFSFCNINKNYNQQNDVNIDGQNKWSHPPIFAQWMNIFCAWVHVCYSKSNQFGLFHLKSSITDLNLWNLKPISKFQESEKTCS